MRKFIDKKILFFLLFSLPMLSCYAKEIPSQTKQLILVVTESWNSTIGFLKLYERANESESWKSHSEKIATVVGKNGLAWGKGLHTKVIDHATLLKKEGDWKSPAGIFSLGSSFGLCPKEEMTHLKNDYIYLDQNTEAVDDPSSKYYNEIVNKQEILAPDWNSSEKMGFEPLYELGFVINNNYPDPIPYKGSAVFFHLWRSANKGTAGCTATSLEDLHKIVSWLDKTKNPVIVQLPIETYFLLQESWDLPMIE